MPNSLLWIGLVAVWLFVLVPMLINRREPIRRTGDATLATRVLHRGGMARMVRRRPGRRSEPTWLRSTSRDDGKVGVDPDDEVDKPADAREAVAAQTDLTEQSEPEPEAVKEDGVAEAVDAEDAAAVAETDSSVTDTGESEPVVVRSAGATLADRMLGRNTTTVTSDVESVTRPVAETSAETVIETVVEDDTDFPSAEADTAEVDPEVAAAEVDRSAGDGPAAPAPRRRGRGGFDPEADARARATRYAARQRTVIVLAVAALLTLAGGIFVLPLLLWLHGVVDLMLVLYLAYLRRQVRMEQEIRRRRMARLARGRLDNAGRDRRRGAVPERLRRPGAVVLEVDDEDPVFDHLEYYHPAVHHDMARAAGQ